MINSNGNINVSYSLKGSNRINYYKNKYSDKKPNQYKEFRDKIHLLLISRYQIHQFRKYV